MLVLDKKTIEKYRPIKTLPQPEPEPMIEEPLVSPGSEMPTVVEEVPPEPIPEPAIQPASPVVASVEAQVAAIANDILKQVATTPRMEAATQLMAVSQKRLADAVSRLADQAAKQKEWDFDIERGLNNQITKVKARQTETV